MSLTVVGITYKASKEENKLAKACLSVIGRDIPLCQYPHNEPRTYINKDTKGVAIAFGNKATTIVRAHIQGYNKGSIVRIEELPELSQLDKDTGNEELRKITFEKLLVIKDQLSSCSKEIIVPAEMTKVGSFSEYYFESNSGDIVVVNKTGEIEEDDIRKPTIAISIEEFNTVRDIVSMLNIKEVRLVKKGIDNK